MGMNLGKLFQGKKKDKQIKNFMINPIKSLFFQYYWWQAYMGHKDIPAPMALCFMLLFLMIYLFSILILIDSYFIELNKRVMDIIMGASIGIIALMLYFNIIYKGKYKEFIYDKRYATITQGIFAILYIIMAIGSFILSLLLSGGNK
ncbi:MAG: hypothetical protein K2G69_07220 [Muribaculaceae bacterium]|nr:hypothetical protein [Muribaculaceae bacterium]